MQHTLPGLKFAHLLTCVMLRAEELVLQLNKDPSLAFRLSPCGNLTGLMS